MKTLTDIKDEIAQEIGYESAENYLSELYEIGSIYTLERITSFINEVAIRTSREALKNASENARIIDTHGEKAEVVYDSTLPDLTYIIDDESILNESNIPSF